MPAKHIVGIPSWYGTARGPGGGYFRDQALALQAAGFRVAMLAPHIHTLRDLRRGRAPASRRARISVEDDGIPTWRRSGLVLLPRVPYRNALAWAWGGLQLFARYIAKEGMPDLVHAHCMLNAGVVALAIKRRHGIPFIVTEQNTSFAQGTLRWWERDLVRRIIAAADKCIAVSPETARLLEGQYPGSRWSYLPNPLGEMFLAGNAPPIARGSTDPFVFLSVARMSAEKGFGRLIEAFAEAFHGHDGVRLQLAGDGPMRNELERLCAERGIADEVDFLGSLSSAQVRAAMEAADVFVLASDFETFGVVVIEALACGRPVIATASGGPDHMVGPKNGMLIPTRDRNALRDALLEMRRRAGGYDAAAIRADALARYSPDAFARRFVEIVN
jgi:L-malate glycosyltransferase